MLITASSIPLPPDGVELKAITAKRDCVAETVPSVAVDGTTKFAGVPVMVVVAPLPSVVDLKARLKAPVLIVRALAATDAEMLIICGAAADACTELSANCTPESDIDVVIYATLVIVNWTVLFAPAAPAAVCGRMTDPAGR